MQDSMNPQNGNPRQGAGGGSVSSGKVSQMDEQDGLAAMKRATEQALEANEERGESSEIGAQVVADLVNEAVDREIAEEDNKQKKAKTGQKKMNQRDDSEGGNVVVEKEIKDSILREVLKKIREAENILIALSNNPSTDELAAAIGLATGLDLIGKHATAIYSGKTPNILDFLKPEETLEANTNVLQDFVIGLNKDKADHLRYKIDGDFVRVYITPYKSLISEKDLEFTRGDYNVDLVITLNVAAATELDGALREYGRIMHGATAINISNGVPGKFGDVEWVDARASSISEMVARLAMELDKQLDNSVATALLTGLVAATDKFSNQATTPEVMILAAKLMGLGADQQLIFKSLSRKLEFKEQEEIKIAQDEKEDEPKKKKDSTKLTVGHNGLMDAEGGEMTEKYVKLSELEPEEEPKDDSQERAKLIKREWEARAKVEEPGTEKDEAEKAEEQETAELEVTGSETTETENGGEAAGPSVDDMIKAAEAVKAEQVGYEMASLDSERESAGQGNAVVDEILAGLDKKTETSSVDFAQSESQTESTQAEPAQTEPVVSGGLPDYGKMIDEALNEKTEESSENQAKANGVDEYLNATEDLKGAVAGVENGINTSAGTGTFGVDTGNLGLGGGQNYGAPMGNASLPESELAPSTEGLPLPGSELTPPPVPPMPDFTNLPQMPSVAETNVANSADMASSADMANSVGAAAETVTGVATGAGPVLNPEPAGLQTNTESFRIPGVQS